MQSLWTRHMSRRFNHPRSARPRHIPRGLRGQLLLLPVTLLIGVVVLWQILSAQPLAAQFAPTQATPSDWAAGGYDAANTRYNRAELQIYPPFSADNAQTIELDEALRTETTLAAPVVVNDQLVWRSPFQREGNALQLSDLDGNDVWSYLPEGESPGYRGAPQVAGDVLLAPIFDYPQGFTGDERSELYAFDLASGAIRWTFPVHWELFVASADTVFTFWDDSTQDQKYLSAVRLSDGEFLYSQEIDYFQGYTYKPVLLGGNLYFYEGSSLHAYRQSDGAHLWTFEDTENRSTVDVFVTAASGLVVISQGARIAAIQANTGTQVWDAQANPDCWADETPLVTDGTYVIRIGVCGSQIHGYQLSSGALLWEQDLGHFAARPAAAANGVLYTAPFPNNSQRLQAYLMSTGEQLQDLDLSMYVGDLMVADGALYATDGLNARVLRFDMGGNGDGYLPAWDNDGDPLTNPVAQTPIPLTARVSGGQTDYGAQIQVGALIGFESATLRVYDSNGAVYKEAVAQPNRLGQGFWVVPVAYVAAGYQYDVELNDGTRLARRVVRMSGDPASNLRMRELLDGLTWATAPGTVNSVPAEITLTLPAGFPSGAVDALLMVDSPARGSNFIAGTRRGNEIVFTLTRNNIVQGSFTISAVARAGNVAAFSSDRAIAFQAPGLASYLPSQVTTVGHGAGGTIESVTYTFERDRPAADPDGTIEAEVAQILPYGGGHQVIVHVTTPPESDPQKAQERPHQVQVTGRDDAGNPISQDSINLPPNLDEVPVTLELPQNGARPIAQIEVSALEPDPNAPPPEPEPFPTPPPPPPPPPLLCSEPNEPPPDDEPDPEDNDPAKRWRVRDLFSVSTSAGVNASGVYWVGAGGGTSVEYNWIQRQATACAEYGVRGGKELGVGPSYSMNFGLNMRGPGHDAPASSGKKVNLTVAAGLGVDLSYTIPDNYGAAGFGSISLGFTAAPKAGVSAGISQVECDDQNNQPPNPPQRRRDCCNGSCNDPLPPPDPPGNNPPDDTLSVVLHNGGNNAFARIDAWANLARLARTNGFGALADYAQFRVELDGLGFQMATFPTNVTLDELTPEQRTVVADYQYLRAHTGYAMQQQWPTILGQWERLMRDAPRVLLSGYYDEAVRMLDEYGIPSRPVGADFSPDELSGLLMIPSGGLFGLADVDAFRARLDRFVSQGGTLLVMAQAGDDALDALPGGAGFGYVGYDNDISCFQAAMTWREYHPMLASLNSTTVDANVDGYLTGLPANARLLLERTKNSQGAFALYPYGQGQMIVTNMYDDWGRAVGQTSPQVRHIFRDVVRWASDPADLPNTGPNGSLTVAVAVVNHSSVAAAQVRYIVRDPFEVEVAQLDPAGLTLTPGASSTESPSISVPASPLGIWRVNYELLDSDGEIIQSESIGSRFTVSDPPPAVLAGQASWLGPVDLPSTAGSPVQSGETLGIDAETGAETGTETDAEISTVANDNVADQQPPTAFITPTLNLGAYSPGEAVALTLDINVPDITGLNEFRVAASLGETSEAQIVTAQVDQQVQFNFPADFSGNGLLYFGLYNEDTGQGLVLDTIWVPARGEFVTVTPDRFAYAPGDTVTLNITSDSARTLSLQGPGLDREVQVNGGSNTVEFDLPVPMARGPFAIRYNDGPNVRAVQIDVQGPALRILEIAVPETDLAGSVAAASAMPADIRIYSDRALDVFVVGEIADAGGVMRQVLVEAVSLVEGEQVVAVTIPFELRTSGLFQFRVKVFDRAVNTLEYVRATRTLATTTPELMAARAADLTTGAGQETRLALDWYSPQARAVEVTIYGPDGELLRQTQQVAAGFSTTEIPLLLEGGSYDLIVAGEVDGLRTTASAVVVVEELQRLYLPELQR